MKKLNQGFVLIEAIIVAAIIGILAAIIVPAVQRHNRTEPIEIGCVK